MATSRPDGRTSSQLRPMKISVASLNRADGAAVYTQGNTEVLSAVYGPTDVKLRDEKIDRTSVQVAFKGRATSFLNTSFGSGMEVDGEDVRAPGFVGYSDKSEGEFTSILTGCVEHCLLTALYPRTAINVTVQVLDDDGASLAAALNAAQLALMDSGIGMSRTVAAVSVGLTEDGAVVLDPTLEEEKELAGSATFALEVAGGQSGGDVVAEYTTGVLTPGQYKQCLAVARASARMVAKFFRKAMTHKFNSSNFIGGGAQ